MHRRKRFRSTGTIILILAMAFLVVPVMADKADAASLSDEGVTVSPREDREVQTGFENIETDVLAQRQTRTRRSSGTRTVTRSRGGTSSRAAGSRSTVYRNRGVNTGSSRYRGTRSHRYYYPRYYGGWGYRSYPLYWGFGFYGHYYPFYLWNRFGTYYGGGYYWPYNYYYRANTGAIDLNIKPKRTQVYLDGHLIGKVGEFDGFPGHLRLREGNYELIFYLDGHETVRKIYRVNQGVILRERFRMNAGTAVNPEELSDPPERPVARKRENLESDHPQNRRRYTYVPEKDRERTRPADNDNAPDDFGSGDLRGEPAKLTFSVSPRDASVYLDGVFIGTGEDLASRDQGWLVDPGDHLLEIIRPGYKDRQTEFVIRKGETIEMSLTLDKE